MDKTRILSAIAVVVVSVPLAALTVFAAEPAPKAKSTIAKICTNCHQAQPNSLQGYFDNVAFKAKTIQIKIDDAVELVKFDEDEIKVVNGEGKTGDGDFLKDNKIKKGHEVKIEYIEKDGVKTAVRLTEKPPVKISADMLMTTPQMAKLVTMGPEKGKYYLFDSRPAPRFQEGAIPTAVNLPYPAFDKQVSKLPADKKALIIFYCSGPTCNMSPGSADKAKKLGYTNIKVYKDGMPDWSLTNYGVLSSQFLKEAWLDKDIPHVLLDVRPAKEAEKGFIKGAVAFPAKSSAKLIKKLALKQKKAPVIVYDAAAGKEADAVAKALVKAGYTNVKILTGGFQGWQAAKFETATGKLTTKVSYVSKPRPGEINLDLFKKYVAAPSADVMILDVRNQDEANSGMLKNAKLIPAEEIKDRAAEIPKDKLIIAHCSTGVRAEMAYHALKELGYTNVKFVNANLEFQKNGSMKIVE